MHWPLPDYMEKPIGKPILYVYTVALLIQRSVLLLGKASKYYLQLIIILF